MHIDQLIHAQWVIPVEPGSETLEQHAVAVIDGCIAAVLPSYQAREEFTADEVIDLPGHALIPGLINSHTHSPMSLFRGLADDLPLMTWLNEHIWPAERKWISKSFISTGSKLAIAEMIRCGTTCFNDMYFFPEVTAEIATRTGIRAAIGLILIDFPSAWAEDADGYLTKAIEVHDQFRSHSLVQTVFAPHAPYSVSDDPLIRLRTLALELDLPIHMHVHETKDEIRQSLDQYMQRPISRLDHLELLSPNLVAVHMTQLENEEIELIAQSGANVVHCPQSNLKLASGFCPVTELLDAGVNVALGTDGAASNNDLDMLEEMRTAALLAKGISGNVGSVPASETLRMATLNGAKALGINDITGSLVIGKSADITAINLNSPESQPVYDPTSQIVYSAGREQVTNVWVKGRRLLENRNLTTLELDSVLEETKNWREKVRPKKEL